MKTIHEVISDVLRREGWPKVTDLPFDRGGLTKGGVTFKWFNRFLAKRGRAPLTETEFKDITEDDAREFYEREFCDPFAFVTDERIFVFLADWAVTSGLDNPTEALQECLKSRGFYQDRIDGKLGPNTRTAWLHVAKDPVMRTAIDIELYKARREFYVDEAFDPAVIEFLKKHPKSQLHNLRGWLNRNDEFLG